MQRRPWQHALLFGTVVLIFCLSKGVSILLVVMKTACRQVAIALSTRRKECREGKAVTARTAKVQQMQFSESVDLGAKGEDQEADMGEEGQIEEIVYQLLRPMGDDSAKSEKHKEH